MKKNSALTNRLFISSAIILIVCAFLMSTVVKTADFLHVAVNRSIPFINETFFRNLMLDVKYNTDNDIAYEDLKQEMLNESRISEEIIQILSDFEANEYAKDDQYETEISEAMVLWIERYRGAIAALIPSDNGVTGEQVVDGIIEDLKSYIPGQLSSYSESNPAVASGSDVFSLEILPVLARWKTSILLAGIGLLLIGIIQSILSKLPVKKCGLIIVDACAIGGIILFCGWLAIYSRLQADFNFNIIESQLLLFTGIAFCSFMSVLWLIYRLVRTMQRGGTEG